MLGFLEKPEPEQIDTNLINAGAYVLEAARARPDRGRPARLDRARDVPVARRRGPLRAGAGAATGRTSARRRATSRRITTCSPGASARSLPGLLPEARWIDEGATVSPDAILEAPCHVAHGAVVAAGALVGAGSSVAADAQIEERAAAARRRRAGAGARGGGRRRGRGRDRAARAGRRRGADRRRRGRRAGRVDPAGRRDSPRGARLPGRRPMSLYEEMFGLVGQLGAQLREGHAAGQAALGRRRPGSTGRPSRSARSAARRSAEASPRRSGATRCAPRPPSTARPRCPAGSVPATSSWPCPTAARPPRRWPPRRAALARGADVIAVTAGEPLGEVAERGRGPGRARPGRPAAARGARIAVRSARGRARVRRRSRRRPPATSAPPRTPATPSPRIAAAVSRASSARPLATTTTWVYGHGPLVGRRAPLQEPAQREREVDGGLRRAARGRPQRDRRLGRRRPHGRPPRRHPPRRPGRSAHDPRQHRSRRRA